MCPPYYSQQRIESLTNQFGHNVVNTTRVLKRGKAVCRTFSEWTKKEIEVSRKVHKKCTATNWTRSTSVNPANFVFVAISNTISRDKNKHSNRNCKIYKNINFVNTSKYCKFSELNDFGIQVLKLKESKRNWTNKMYLRGVWSKIYALPGTFQAVIRWEMEEFRDVRRSINSRSVYTVNALSQQMSIWRFPDSHLLSGALAMSNDV